MVRFDPATAKHLDRYLRAGARHPRYARRRDLWIGFRGPLTRKGVPAILDKRTAMAGIGHIHARQLRHTWSHRWLANGGSEQDLMRLGGWSSHEIMARYGSAQAVDRALAAYDNVDPMGELRAVEARCTGNKERCRGLIATLFWCGKRLPTADLASTTIGGGLGQPDGVLRRR